MKEEDENSYKLAQFPLFFKLFFFFNFWLFWVFIAARRLSLVVESRAALR